MYDLKWIRDNPAAFDEGRRRRGLAPLSEQVKRLDDRRRAAIVASQASQERRNAVSKEIGAAMKAGDKETAERLKAEVAALKLQSPTLEADEKQAISALDTLLAEIPNQPLDSVPEGKDEEGNVLLREVGARHTVNFKPKEHFELGEALGMMDFETATKLSGARFVVNKGPLARLERALGQFMLDLHTDEHGYTEVNPPILVRDESMFGTAQLPKFRDDQFLATREGDLDGARDLWLIPTAEVPLTNLVRDDILDEATLPLRFTACTPCFRAEAGAAGRDTRGMIRQHQFTKVELVSITTPEQSEAEHTLMLECAEEVLKRLELPYRVMTLVHWRHGLREPEDLRHRGLVARAGPLSRDLLLLGLRRLPGAADERALPRRRCQDAAFRAHAERLRRRRRSRARCRLGELPGRGRRHPRAGGAEAVYGRPDTDRAPIDPSLRAQRSSPE